MILCRFGSPPKSIFIGQVSPASLFGGHCNLKHVTTVVQNSPPLTSTTLTFSGREMQAPDMPSISVIYLLIPSKGNDTEGWPVEWFHSPLRFVVKKIISEIFP